MSLIDSLGERIGPFPAWLWALVGGIGLYWFAHRQANTEQQGLNLGSVAAPIGAPLELNPNATNAYTNTNTVPLILQPAPFASNGINSQPGAAVDLFSSNIPTGVPIVSGGDNPFIGGYVGLRRATPYDYARGGPS